MVLWSASVLSRCLGNIGVLIFVLGTEDGPSVLSKLCSTCTAMPYYLLKVKVHGFDEFCNFCGCEMVGWVSEKSGCPLFPGKITSINLPECT